MPTLQRGFLKPPCFNGHCLNITTWMKSLNLTMSMRLFQTTSKDLYAFLTNLRLLMKDMIIGKYYFHLLPAMMKKKPLQNCSNKWRQTQDSTQVLSTLKILTLMKMAFMTLMRTNMNTGSNSILGKI